MGAHISLSGISVVHGITFDPGAGIGARMALQRTDAPVETFVLMRPAIFLDLASPLPTPRPSLDWIKAQIMAGRPVCPPMLRVWLPPRHSEVPAVLAHDGRHRCFAMRTLLGERATVPVRIELPTLPSDAEVPEATIALMRAGMRRQRGDRGIVPGPLFEVSGEDANARTAASHPVRAPPGRWRRRQATNGPSWRPAQSPGRRGALLPPHFLLAKFGEQDSAT
jgi:hypothetical protein